MVRRFEEGLPIAQRGRPRPCVNGSSSLGDMLWVACSSPAPNYAVIFFAAAIVAGRISFKTETRELVANVHKNTNHNHTNFASRTSSSGNVNVYLGSLGAAGCGPALAEGVGLQRTSQKETTT